MIEMLGPADMKRIRRELLREVASAFGVLPEGQLQPPVATDP